MRDPLDGVPNTDTFMFCLRYVCENGHSDLVPCMLPYMCRPGILSELGARADFHELMKNTTNPIRLAEVLYKGIMYDGKQPRGA